MSYPHRFYLSFYSCGYRIMPDPEIDGAHVEAPRPQTVPCGPTPPDEPEPKRISRFNFTGTARPDNPALLSPIEAYRQRRRAGRRRTVGAFVVLALLICFGIGTVALGVAQSSADALDESNVFSGALPLLPFSDDPKAARAATSTPQQDWKQGTVPSLYQNDPQWSAKPYASSTLGACGQAPLCMAMVNVALTGSHDVLPMDAAKTIEEGGFASNGATDASFIPETAAALGLDAVEVSADESSVRRQIIAGKPVICVMGPGDFAETQSFIVLSGIDMDSKLVVHDPASDSRSKGWDFETILGQAESLWAISAPAASA